jgi:archaellin
MSSVAVCAMVAATMLPLAVFAQSASTNTVEQSVQTTTPIKHAIFIIGENRSSNTRPSLLELRSSRVSIK